MTSSLIGQMLKVTVNDNRVVFGTLECLDGEENIVLGNAIQKIGEGKYRPSGFIMIPGKHIVKVEKKKI